MTMFEDVADPYDDDEERYMPITHLATIQQMLVMVREYAQRRGYRLTGDASGTVTIEPIPTTYPKPVIDDEMPF